MSGQALGSQKMKDEALKLGSLDLGFRVAANRITGKHHRKPGSQQLKLGIMEEVWLRDVPGSSLVASARTSLRETHWGSVYGRRWKGPGQWGGGSPSLVLCEQRPEPCRCTLSGSALGGGQERGSLLLVSIFKIQFLHSSGLNK